MVRYTLALCENVSADNIKKYTDFCHAIFKFADNKPENCSTLK